jgi:hypothetical protein
VLVASFIFQYHILDFDGLICSCYNFFIAVIISEVWPASLGQSLEVLRLGLQRRQSVEWPQVFGTAAGKSLGLVQSAQPYFWGSLRASRPQTQWDVTVGLRRRTLGSTVSLAADILGSFWGWYSQLEGRPRKRSIPVVDCRSSQGFGRAVVA